MHTPAIVATGLRQGYGHRAVLTGLDLELTGGVVGVLGPNGSGKTTLITTLATLRRPTGGDLRVLGHDVSLPAGRRAVRRELGYLPQDFGYHPRFTAQEFVEYAGWLKRVPRRRLTGQARDALGAVGLLERAGDQLRTLSGGMLRRAGIAAAVVNRPALLLLDEPSAGLDPAQRVGLRELVRELSAGTCVLLSTHLVEDVSATCSWAVVISEGRLVFAGTPDALSGAASADAPGDSPLERGYSNVLAAAERPTDT